MDTLLEGQGHDFLSDSSHKEQEIILTVGLSGIDQHPGNAGAQIWQRVRGKGLLRHILPTIHGQ